MDIRLIGFGVGLVLVLGAMNLRAQNAGKSAAPESSSSVKADLAKAEHGHCAEALPALKRGIARLESRELRRQAGIDGVRCAMSLNRPDDAVDFLRVLKDFSLDPEVLYLLVHTYSDLSTRAGEQLAQSAPNSAEAHELNAEALEQQGKWDQAAAEYNAVLKQHPDV
jgi:tetratricopeptide (TPR) repeat protein